jgi:hypothetical protein
LSQLIPVLPAAGVAEAVALRLAVEPGAGVPDAGADAGVAAGTHGFALATAAFFLWKSPPRLFIANSAPLAVEVMEFDTELASFDTCAASPVLLFLEELEAVLAAEFGVAVAAVLVVATGQGCA